ncbi:hypothetical protein OC846_002706 [Tilletia horrida]|uniref:ClpP/crotonase n=1 Tax=Tilletia horrida TaxID=155126 RepID=A0AAN6GQ82_9BASI|nr:hypothetical protein OC845_003400 [Tilletia horrida]KAK0552868.1 hypothetical protein OC846_002706 [Tilletia horrida]KAK0567241.1 hypothetical protein OC861_002838 [Tilletia horrida]
MSSIATKSVATPVNFPPKGDALIVVTEPEDFLFVLTMTGAETSDNRLTHAHLEAWLQALDYIEQRWDNIPENKKKEGAAMVTTASTDPKQKIWSNGLDFAKAIADPHFFDTHLFRVYERLLSFPIPSVASVGGHAFAGGFGLAACHDYRVMHGNKGFLCMNEIHFGAQLPPGLYAALTTKIASPAVARSMVLEGHRFPATQAKAAGFVDLLAPDVGKEGGPAETLEAAVKLASKLRPLCARDAWGSNKLVLYSYQLAVLREKNTDATSKL